MIVWPRNDGMTWDATVTKVTDGDTVTVDINLGAYIAGKDRTFGFHLYVHDRRLHVHQALRLYGINAPEVNTAAGETARDMLAALVWGETLPVTTWLDRNDKYGRLLGRLGEANEWMIEHGYALPYSGEGPKPTP